MIVKAHLELASKAVECARGKAQPRSLGERTANGRAESLIAAALDFRRWFPVAWLY
jgi:hypothetical protein